MAVPVIPDFQPVPFPLPLWLLQILIVVGFFLHVIPMNIVLGGTLLAGVLVGKNKNDPQSYGYRAGRKLAASLPLFLSFAITQGIVPLLFLQLMYGPLYYTSSIAMAWPWIAILGVLMVGYYALYIFKYKADGMGAKSVWLLLGSFVLFAAIGFTFTGNMVLMLNPQQWPALLDANTSGWAFNFDEPQLIPRYLHFLIGAFAVTGLAVGGFGVYYKAKDEGYGNWLIKKGATIFLSFTGIQLASGAWFLMTLSREARLQFMGQEPLYTAAFVVSLLTIVLAIGAAIIAFKKHSAGAMKLAITSGLVTVLGMVIMRHGLRVFMTEPFFHPETVPLKTQWDLLIAFLISAVLLVVYLVWLSRFLWKSFQNPPQVEG